MRVFAYLPIAFEDVVFPWQQGGVLDKISVTNFGIIVLAVLAVVVLIDSEISWLSEDELECRQCRREAGSERDFGQSTAAVPTRSRLRRRLRYRSRTLARFTTGSGPGRAVTASRRSRDHSPSCRRCRTRRGGRIRAEKVDK